jgi:peptidoglycan/LPS O-acetylase OafA/YrhL
MTRLSPAKPVPAIRQSPSGSWLAYRPDVDGLRAIAVCSVIVYHLWPVALPGGFIGVDIFFVISGYLISLQIYRQTLSDRFSIADFYRRRVKRIAPAMLTVLAVTVLAAEVLLRPADSEAVSRSGLWTLVSLANVYFWLHEDSSYFAAATDELPLLHYWSLGVEEQFYLIWPLILLLVGKRIVSSRFGWALGIVIVASFLFGQYFFSTDSGFVYYMLPARAGELMLGAVAARAVILPGSRPAGDRLASLAASMALIVLIGSLFLVSNDRVFPGFQAIPPTLATAILLLSGHVRHTAVRRLLQIRPLVLIGLISYSAYLWHWPILAFLRYGGVAITPVVGAAVIAATGLLATISYKLIETPFRRSTRSFPAVLLRQYALPCAFLGAFLATSLKTDGYALRWLKPDYRAELEAVRSSVRPAYLYDFVCQVQRLDKDDLVNPACVVGRQTAGAKRVILIGDSIAAQYVGMLGEFADSAGFEFRNIAVGGCPPVIGNYPAFLYPQRVPYCEASIPLAWAELDRYDVVMMAANWTFYSARSDEFMTALVSSLDDLRRRGKEIIILGKSPVIPRYDRLCREKAISFPNMDCQFSAVELAPDVRRVNARLRELAARLDDIGYFDANDYLCPDGACDVNDARGIPRYFDALHLSLPASTALGRQIIQADGVPVEFRRLGGEPAP